jgi:hypothetical protein
MKSRLALMLMIVAGLMLSTTGATLAVTGSSGSGSAAQNEYLQEGEEGVSGGERLAGEEGDAAAQPDEAAEAQPAQEAAQAEAAAGGDGLPFTGFLAIPLLIGGVALMGTGAVLRWKARN